MPPPPPPVRTPRVSPRSTAPYLAIALGCGGAVVLVSLIAGGIFAALYMSNKSVSPAVDEYLDRVGRGQFTEAYEDTHPKFKEALTLEQFERFERGIVEALGAYKSKSIRGINVNSFNGVTTTVARYRMTFEKGAADGTFTLIGNQIAGVDYVSPQLQFALKCPYCGVVLNAFGNFCPECGKRLQPAAEAEATP